MKHIYYTLITIITICVQSCGYKTTGQLIMDYGTGIYDFENANVKIAQFDSLDNFTGFKHVHYNDYNPKSWGKIIKKREIENKKLLAHILDSLNFINPINDTVTIIQIHYYERISSDYIIMAKKNSLFIEFESGGVYHCHPLDYFITKETYYYPTESNERNAYYPNNTFVEAISKINENQLVRLINCSMNIVYPVWISISWINIKDSRIKSRETFVIPYFNSWCIHDRYAPDNPYRLEIDFDDRIYKYNKMIQEGKIPETLPYD